MAHKAAAAVGLAVMLMLLMAAFGRAGAQVLAPKPEDVRFQLLGNEPIAAPDERSVVAGWSALVVKDRVTGQCYLALTAPGGMGMTVVGCQR